jgi:hypothetical protein
MAPPPNCHLRDAKRARRSGAAVKRYSKCEIVLSAGQPTLKSRCCYGTVTCPHLDLKACLRRPRHKKLYGISHDDASYGADLLQKGGVLGPNRQL